ncbi:MAG: hypothetical protein JNL82_13420 [Myxococcales bacterium]|nr:hypothetical protein [Myxococcales bacterium]
MQSRDPIHRTPRVRSSLFAGALLCLAIGCDESAADHSELRDGTASSTCGTWRCGFNAAEINGRSLQSLNLHGEANEDGVKIVGFTPPALYLLGSPWTLAVEDDEFVAKRGNQRLRGKQLIGSTILIQVPLGLPIPVTILNYEEVPSWADGAAPIGAYTLVSLDVGSLLKRNVCSGSLLDPLVAAATIIGGETYDNATKSVEAGREGWFTIACAGSAAAKMKLMGYSPQTEFDGTGQPSTVDQRTATLKMITADYCGTGHSYTETGTPVVWNNLAGSVDSSVWHTPGEVEAVWNESGAVCLGATRLAGADVECASALPSCADHDIGDGEWITRVAAP